MDIRGHGVIKPLILQGGKAPGTQVGTKSPTEPRKLGRGCHSTKGPEAWPGTLTGRPKILLEAGYGSVRKGDIGS